MVERKEALNQFRTLSANGQKIEQNEIEVVHLEGGIDIDLQRNIVIQNGALVDRLSINEWEVLRHLASNIGKAVPKQQIIATSCMSQSSLWSSIRQIRKKLNFDQEDGPLKVVAGFGYILDDGRENLNSVVKAAGGIEVDFDRRQVKKDDTLVQVTAHEFQIIELLASNMGKVVPKSEILNQVWGDPFYDEEIKVYLNRIRRKLGISSKGPIVVLRGLGVILLTPEMEEAEKAKVYNQDCLA